MAKKIFSSLSPGLGIDLGANNTLIYLKGRGIVVSEPSVVALNKKTGDVLAVGQKAKEMVGKTPGHLEAVYPIVNGVIADFELAEQMLGDFFRRLKKINRSFFPYQPLVVATVPCATTDVEKKAVEDVILAAGASRVYLVEEPVAAAVGARLPVFEPFGNIIVNIGAGISEIAVVSLGGIVRSKSLKIAGQKFNEDIIKYLREEYGLLIGQPTAEKIKLEIGSAKPISDEKLEMEIRGRDLSSGLPREIKIGNKEISRSLHKSVNSILEAVHDVIEETPPELLADIYQRNIWLSGGGSLLRGLDEAVSEASGLKAERVDDPLTSAVRGAGFILENLDKYKELIIRED